MYILFLILLLLCPSVAWSAVDWAGWISGTTTPGLVVGTVGGVEVKLTAPSVLSAHAGTSGGVVYWRNSPTYVSVVVPNAPTTADIIKLSAAQTYTLTFASPVVDPVIALVSLGGLASVMWDFGNVELVLLSKGPGAFGNGPLEVSGGLLAGHEGHGVIQAKGTFTSLSWTMDVPDNWVGFTVGLPPQPQVVPIPVPTPLRHTTAHILWEYPADDFVLYGITGFRLYEGVGAECAAAGPLHVVEGDIPGTERATVRAVSLPVDSVVCYEMIALSLRGNSTPSSRSSKRVGDLIGVAAAPFNLTIQ